MFKRIILIILSVVFYSGCRQSALQLPFDDIVYVENFPHSYELTEGSAIDFGKIGIQDLMICDTLLLLSSQNQSGFISSINLRTGMASKDFLRRGNAFGEVLYMPFFSTVNKVSRNGKTCLVHSDNKGNLLCWCPEDLYDEDYPDIEMLTDSVPVNSFYTLYVNDSTFICRNVSGDASRQERYLLASGKRETTGSMDKLNSLSIPVKGDGYMFNILSSFSCYNNDRDVVVEASLMLNTIYLYSLDRQFERAICYGSRVDNINDVFQRGLTGLRETFTRLNIYDDFFAVMYDGGKMYEELNFLKSNPEILIFDWNGNPVAKLGLPCPADVFDIDVSSGTLYTLDRESEIIRKYDIFDVMKVLAGLN